MITATRPMLLRILLNADMMRLFYSFRARPNKGLQISCIVWNYQRNVQETRSQKGDRCTERGENGTFIR